MENKKWDKIENEFDKIFSAKGYKNKQGHRCSYPYFDGTTVKKDILTFFKKQFQNQRQEFVDIVESKIRTMQEQIIKQKENKDTIAEDMNYELMEEKYFD